MSMLQTRVDLEGEVQRYPMGILSRAEDLPPDWENGILFRTTGCAEPEILGPCVVSDSTEVRPGDAEFDPVFVRQSAACSTISQVGTTDIARRRLEGTTEWALGQVLTTGVGSTNPSRMDAVEVHAIDDLAGNRVLQMVDLVACLEQAAADTGYGATALLHAPPQAAPYLQAANLIDDFGLTPTGLRWVISPGYQSDAGVDSTILWVWATGGLWAEVTAVEDLLNGSSRGSITNWRTNLDAAYAQRLGLAAFDPCVNLTATMAVPACNGES